MSVHFDKNKFLSTYGNLTDKLGQLNVASKNVVYDSYTGLLNRLENIEMPKIPVNLQPDRLMGLYSSFFSPRMVKNKMNDTIEIEKDENEDQD